MERRLLLMDEELFTILMERPIKDLIREKGKVPVVEWGEAQTEEVTFYTPVISIKPLDKSSETPR